MKRRMIALLLAVLYVAGAAWTGWAAMDMVSDYTRRINEEKTALVQQRLGETIALLEGLCQDGYIRDPQIAYEEKAVVLTEKNQSEGLGYMMLRILDQDVNIYREGLGLTSNLGSRDYMQRAYSTGQTQVTDAFLAGADGKTVNYTVVATIQDNGQVTGALMAAIYGEELDGYLQDDRAETVLVGSQLQYMGGVDREQFGLPVAQVLEEETSLSRPVENILLDFQEGRGGTFWGMRRGVQYFVYSPVAQSRWVVMTEVEAVPLIRNILIAQGCGTALLLVAALMLRYWKGPQPKQTPEEVTEEKDH